MAQPLISICIPAYKKAEYVVRCIRSVLKQTYKQVEIVISDDSPGEDIKVALEPFTGSLPIFYHHNQPPLKSPKNWNVALDKARGELVLLMHQDDWFFTEDALEQYVAVFSTKPEVDFVFRRNTAVDEQGAEIVFQAQPQLLHRLHQKPDHLLLAQVIGPPSNTVLRRRVSLRYDEQFIWLVDVDYYVRLLKAGHRYFYIDKHLVNIGLHEDQTTAYCRANSDIIFRENIFYAKKLEPNSFNDVLIYDYYWRLLRNYKIRSIGDILINGIKESEIPGVIRHMLKHQLQYSLRLLNMGFFSKTAMALSYAAWKVKKEGS